MSFSHFFILIFIVYLGVRGDNGPQPIEDYPNITCGKKNPKKEKDCTKYGTDSGMLCCWVAKTKDSNEGKCTLLSQKIAEDQKFQLNDFKQFDDLYWSCGNKSFYLRTDIFLIIILIVLTLLY